ncbi:hypothetical protein EVAR_6835_1 [Eumeta japonica]|uniref:Uncharacterized protein n=1 Tax=Eumeta variegata TaxID=151549 RepID=A0A4C1U665_EUMVA|nr:hypothetical protein EVAR_6835_1 [Eumeta japonica]
MGYTFIERLERIPTTSKHVRVLLCYTRWQQNITVQKNNNKASVESVSESTGPVVEKRWRKHRKSAIIKENPDSSFEDESKHLKDAAVSIKETILELSQRIAFEEVRLMQTECVHSKTEKLPPSS